MPGIEKRYFLRKPLLRTMQAFPPIALWSQLRTARDHCLKAAYHMSSLHSPHANANKNNATEVCFGYPILWADVTDGACSRLSVSKVIN
jgi:hypothetical protein